MQALSSFVSIAVLLAACSSAPQEQVSQPPKDLAVGALALESCDYTQGEVAYSAECGWLAVPENRSDERSRPIHLPVTRVHALGSDPLEPVYYLEGGPGISNLDFSHLAGIIERHDVVMVGYRGVDGPVVLDCPEYSDHLGNPPGDFMSQEAFDASIEAYRQCAERLTAEGIDLEGYTVAETIEDMEAARRAFGDEQLNTLSQSYGTRLAMLWAWTHPQSLRRSAMIGVNPPGHFIWDSLTVERQLERYSALCAADVGCSSRTRDLAEAMRGVSRAMPSRWMFLRIKEGNIRVVTFMMLYHTTSAPKVLDAWLDAAEGDASGLATLSLMADLMFGSISMVWGESVAKVASVDYEWEPGRDYLAEYMPEGSILGAPASSLGTAGAGGWPGKMIGHELRQVQTSSVETLLVSGSLDFSTPAEFARDELLPYLENGHQVILTEFGHTEDVWALQPEATRRLLTTFYATGEIDDSLFTENRVNFDSGLGFGTMIKLALLACVVALVLLSLGLRWLWRRRR